MALPKLTVYEVGLRDGLQNQGTLVSTEAKLRMLRALHAAGIRRFEATSFVSAKAVPQLADAADVIAGASQYGDSLASALIINEKGYVAARDAGVRSVSLVVVLTETLCQKNNRMSVDECVDRAIGLLRRASTDGVHTRVYVAPAWVCPYEGVVPRERVLHTVGTLMRAEPSEIAIADTIGQAHPLEVGSLFATLARRFDIARFAAHLHDTTALGLANAAAAIAEGVRTIDASIGGLGGCPFAPGSAGNLATEDLVLMAEKMGLSTQVNLDALWDAVEVAEDAVGRPLGGRTKSYWQSRKRESRGESDAA